MANIDNLSIQVTASAEEARRTLDRLASSASRVRVASQGASGGMQDMAQSAQDAGTETREAGEQAGRAEGNMRRFGRSTEQAGRAARRGASGIGHFWQMLKRIAMMRFIRSIIREIASAFGEGIKNLYHWSDAVNGHFAASMDRLATSSQYLKNSLGAMVSPLIETLIPVLDVIIDKVVDVLNFFNMLVSAVSGAGTYTVAKKAAAVWDDSANKTRKAAKSAADDIKRTILGFDEINKLVKPNSSSGGSGSSSGKSTPNYSAMFEEKPLTGIFKKISDITSGWPDWLKALLGVGTAGLAIFGIPALLRTIWNWLKKLFTLDVPNWFRWLFGPKGDGSGGGDGPFDLPNEIKLPDAELPVDLVKDDWDILDDINGKPVYLSPRLDNKPEVLLRKFKDGWDDIPSRTLYFTPKLDNTANALFDQFKKDWNRIPRRTLYMSPKLDNTANVLWSKFQKEWDSAKKPLYATPKLDNTGKALWEIFKKEWERAKSILYASPKLDNTGKALWNTLKAEWEKARTTLYASPKLDNTGTALWRVFKGEWEAAKSTLYASPKLDNTGSALWSTLKNEWERTRQILYASPNLDNTGTSLWRVFKAAWDSAKSILYASPKLDNTGTALWRVFKDEWDRARTTLYASPKLDNTAKVLLDGFKSAWDAYMPTVKVKVELTKDNWTTVTDMLDNNFGGASGGGGISTGGGAGRGRHGSGSSGIGSYPVTVQLEKGWYGTPQSALGVDDMDATVDVDMWSPWSYWHTPPIKWLQMDDLKSTVSVDMWTPWWATNRSPLQWLQMDNLVATVNVVANVTNAQNTIKAATNLSGSYQTKAFGGVFSANRWTDIPQYAGGTLSAHGSLFLAGEAGPEIVGHVGGRTEVLNKSQIAAAMYSAVQAAMAPVTATMAYAAQSMGANSDGIDGEALASMIQQAVENAMSRSNDIARQGNEYLRQISDKDFTSEISTSSINKAQTRMNRRAGVTLVPVGT